MYQGKLKLYLTGVVFIVIIAILLHAIFSSLALPNYQSPDPNIVGIKGEIRYVGKGTPESSSNSFLYAYSPYENPYYICQSKLLAVTNIEWSDSKTGTYYLPLNMPVNSNIILTTNCMGCFNNSVFVKSDKKDQNFDLKFDNSVCYSSYKIPEEFEEIIQEARQINDATDTEIYQKDLNQTQSKEVKEFITRSRDFITNGNRDNSIIDAYSALSYAIHARTRLFTYDLQNCVNEIESIKIDYNSLCYQLPYQTKSDYNSVFNASIAGNSPYFNTHVLYDGNITRIKDEINWLHSKLENASSKPMFCNQQKNLIKNSLESQKQYCETRDRIDYSML